MSCNWVGNKIRQLETVHIIGFRHKIDTLAITFDSLWVNISSASRAKPLKMIPQLRVLPLATSFHNYLEVMWLTRQIIQERNFKQPTLVTLDLYTRRAVATARRMGWQDFYWLSVYSSGEPAYGWKRIQTHSRFTLYLYEVLAMVYSRMVGWV